MKKPDVKESFLPQNLIKLSACSNIFFEKWFTRTNTCMSVCLIFHSLNLCLGIFEISNNMYFHPHINQKDLWNNFLRFFKEKIKFKLSESLNLGSFTSVITNKLKVKSAVDLENDNLSIEISGWSFLLFFRASFVYIVNILTCFRIFSGNEIFLNH